MTGIKHAFTSAKSDGGDATVVRPSNWNAPHVGLSYLNELTLHGTHGDDFDGASLNARWTAHGAFDADATQFAVGGTWMQFVTGSTQLQAIYQAAPAKETFEVIASFSMYSADADNQVGLAIVSSTGTGVMCAFRPAAVDQFVLNTVSAYAYNGDGTALGIGDGSEFTRGRKVWMSLRKVLSDQGGIIYFARFSGDGFTWSKAIALIPSAFTDAKIGFGRLYGGAIDELIGIDRFNVVDDLDQSPNRLITPTSGTVTPTASSSYPGYGPERAIDGTANDWSANDGTVDNPLYWQAVWSVGQSLNRVLLLERGGDAFGRAHLELYNGATTIVPVRGHVGGGALWHVVDFPTLTGVTQLRVVSDGGASTNPGFTAIEAYLRS